MKHKYTIDIFGRGLDELIQGVEDYKKWIQEKSALLASRLADLGATYADAGFANAFYDGPADSISVEPVNQGDPLHYKVIANGETVLFIEFGAGITLGYGHPEAGENGMGPGTYPGKGHWDDPGGWYLPNEKGGGHTFGNPPNAPMYTAVKTLKEQLEDIVRMVFRD